MKLPGASEVNCATWLNAGKQLYVTAVGGQLQPMLAQMFLQRFAGYMVRFIVDNMPVAMLVFEHQIRPFVQLFALLKNEIGDFVKPATSERHHSMQLTAAEDVEQFLSIDKQLSRQRLVNQV